MTDNIHLEVVGCKPPLALEGVQLLLKLPGPMLSKNGSKKHDLKFLEGSANIAGVAELIDTGLCRGLLDNELEFGISHGRINDILTGSLVIHCFEQLGIGTAKVNPMLVCGDNGALLDHHLVWVAPDCLILVLGAYRIKGPCLFQEGTQNTP